MGCSARTLAFMASTRDIDSMDFAFENSFHDSMEGFYAPAEAAKPPAPKLLLFIHALAGRLGIDVAGATDEQMDLSFSGGETPEGDDPQAPAYAGHPFDHFYPPLGDEVGSTRSKGRGVPEGTNSAG